MALTKSILIVIFSLMCVIGGTLSPYTIAGVNEKEVTENQIDITLPEYEDEDLINVSKYYIDFMGDGVGLDCYYLNSEIYFYEKCSCDNINEFNLCLKKTNVVSSDFTYNLYYNNLNGERVIFDSRKCIYSFIINSFDSVYLLIDIYSFNSLTEQYDNLVSSQKIENLIVHDWVSNVTSLPCRNYYYMDIFEGGHDFFFVLDIHIDDINNYANRLHVEN